MNRPKTAPFWSPAEEAELRNMQAKRNAAMEVLRPPVEAIHEAMVDASTASDVEDEDAAAVDWLIANADRVIEALAPFRGFDK